MLCTMAKEVLSKAELKRQIDQMSKDLYNIDLQLQGVRQGKPNPFSKEQLKQGSQYLASCRAGFFFVDE